MENKKVIQVKDLTKMYKLYDKPSDRLKEALGLTRKKLYKEHYALHDVNFDIYEGECVGIIGTNGSGKSTILKIIRCSDSYFGGGEGRWKNFCPAGIRCRI